MTSGYDAQTAARLATAGEEAAAAFTRRSEPTAGLAAQADAVAQACHAMAVRFHQGGKLVVFGTGTASTDAQHVAVEFVHPVIVGKRALPAISLTTDVATVTGIAEREGMDAIFSHQLRYLAAPVPNTTSLPPRWNLTAIAWHAAATASACPARWRVGSVRNSNSRLASSPPGAMTATVGHLWRAVQ